MAEKNTTSTVVKVDKKPAKDKTKSPKTQVGKYVYATGRRKTSVARVRLYQNGTGSIEVNGKNYKEYFPTAELQFSIRQPLILLGATDKFDFTIKVLGGGYRGQAEAIRHGISRTLEKNEGKERAALKAAGFLRRDPRRKERKKPGLRGARRAPQFSKR